MVIRCDICGRDLDVIGQRNMSRDPKVAICEDCGPRCGECSHFLGTGGDYGLCREDKYGRYHVESYACERFEERDA